MASKVNVFISSWSKYFMTQPKSFMALGDGHPNPINTPSFPSNAGDIQQQTKLIFVQNILIYGYVRIDPLFIMSRMK